MPDGSSAAAREGRRSTEGSSVRGRQSAVPSPWRLVLPGCSLAALLAMAIGYHLNDLGFARQPISMLYVRPAWWAYHLIVAILLGASLPVLDAALTGRRRWEAIAAAALAVLLLLLLIVPVSIQPAHNAFAMIAMGLLVGLALLVARRLRHPVLVLAALAACACLCVFLAGDLAAMGAAQVAVVVIAMVVVNCDADPRLLALVPATELPDVAALLERDGVMKGCAWSLACVVAAGVSGVLALHWYAAPLVVACALPSGRIAWRSEPPPWRLPLLAVPLAASLLLAGAGALQVLFVLVVMGLAHGAIAAWDILS